MRTRKKDDAKFMELCGYIGEEIREQREGFFYTIKDVSQDLGVNASQLSDMERGKKPFSLHNFLSLCDGLGLKPHEVLRNARIRAGYDD